MCALLCHALGLYVLHEDSLNGCRNAPTRHKALKTLMRDITNTDAVLNHIRTGHIALVTTHDDDLLTERQWAQVTHMVMTQY